MGKRLTLTEKWDDPWFMALPMPHKILWVYICDRCDNAGVWQINEMLLRVHVGEVSLADALVAFAGRVRPIADGRKWYLTKFLGFQYPGGLNPKTPPHRQVIQLLSAHGLETEMAPLLKKSQGVLEGVSDAPLNGAPTIPDHPISSLQGGAGGKPDLAATLTSFGLGSGPKAVEEWRGGVNKIAKIRSPEELRAFLTWAIAVRKRHGESVEHWRHVRELGFEWDAGQRQKVYTPAMEAAAS